MEEEEVSSEREEGRRWRGRSFHEKRRFLSVDRSSCEKVSQGGGNDSSKEEEDEEGAVSVARKEKTFFGRSRGISLLHHPLSLPLSLHPFSPCSTTESINFSNFWSGAAAASFSLLSLTPYIYIYTILSFTHRGSSGRNNNVTTEPNCPLMPRSFYSEHLFVRYYRRTWE